MKKHPQSKKETNCRTSKASSNGKCRSGQGIGFEQLEDRTVPAVIQWANRADFDNEFGNNTAAARALIDQALLDWGSVIESFNYRNIGQNGWAPRDYYSIHIEVRNLDKGILADGKATDIDDDGKPYSGRMRIDTDADGEGWAWTANPVFDHQYITPITPFAANGGPSGIDLYSTVLHEMGHALGLDGGDLDLRFPSAISNHRYLMSNLQFAYFVDDPDDGDDRDEHLSSERHPNDLMVPKTGARERQLISDLDARLLGDIYGYTIDFDQIGNRSFAAVVDPRTGVLTINGDLGTTFNRLSNIDEIVLDVGASETYVKVNGYEKRLATSAITSIDIFAKNGGDRIDIEATRNGIPVDVNAGKGQNSVHLAPVLKNLQRIQGNIDVEQNGDKTKLYFHDENNLSARGFEIYDEDVQISHSPGNIANVKYSGYTNRLGIANPARNIDQLLLYGGSGGNTFIVANDGAAQTFTNLYTGRGNDTVEVDSLSVKGGEIDGVNGTDTVTVGVDSRSGLRDILGPLRVLNSQGWTDLTYDDSADLSSSRKVKIYSDRVTGLGPGTMYYQSSSEIPSGIRTLNVLTSSHAGGQGNSITVFSTPQNRANNLVVNLATGLNNDRVEVERTRSRLNIEGRAGDDRVIVGSTGFFADNISFPVAVDSAAGKIALSIVNSLDTTEREMYVSDLGLGISSAVVEYNESTLKSLAFFGGSGKTKAIVLDTPQIVNPGAFQTHLEFGAAADDVTVYKTTGVLRIAGGGERDNVTIGYFGRLGGINGAIEILNSGISGYTNVHVDGSEEFDPLVGIVDATSVRGFTTANINFQQQSLGQLVVSGGKGGNTITVANTPQNAIESVGVIINAGIGVDTVNVLSTRSGTAINGQNGRDTVNVGLAGNTQFIRKNLYITNSSSYSTINLDDSNDNAGRVVTLDVAFFPVTGLVGTIEGLSPGLIYFKQADLAALNIWGTGYLDLFRVRNTALSGVPGGSPTTIHGGDGADTFRVTATTGELIIDPDGSNNLITLGSADGLNGSLTPLRGKVSVVGEGGTGNYLEILDRSSTDSYTYTMDAASLVRANLTGTGPAVNLAFGEYTTVGINVAAAHNGNQFDILGTPNSVPALPGGGIQINSGNGNDLVNVFGAGSGRLNIDLGGGAIQRIGIGDAAHSLDNIYSEVRVTGGGFIDAVISDTASTTAHNARFERNSQGQFVGRYALNASGQEIDLKQFFLNFAQAGRVVYNAGGAAIIGTYNQIDVNGVASNAEVIVNGGPNRDLFTAGFGQSTANLLSQVTFNSTDPLNDFGYYYDAGKTTSSQYAVRTNSQDGTGFIMSSAGQRDVIFNGIYQLLFYTPLVGGNSIEFMSKPTVTMIVIMADQDRVTMGSSGSSLGGTMDDLLGGFQFQSYRADDRVEFTLDDSGNSTTARQVLIEPHPFLGGFGVITGLGPSRVELSDNPNWTIAILAGSLDDTILMRGAPLSSQFVIDGGFGNDVLIGSGGNTLVGGAGRDLLIAGSLGSKLSGGLSEDILIGGSLNDNSQQNVDAIRAVWSNIDTDYDSRVSSLLDSLLADDKITDNGSIDALIGGLDALDLFFGDPEAEVGDWQEGEQIVTLL